MLQNVLKQPAFAMRLEYAAGGMAYCAKSSVVPGKHRAGNISSSCLSGAGGFQSGAHVGAAEGGGARKDAGATLGVECSVGLAVLPQPVNYDIHAGGLTWPAFVLQDLACADLLTRVLCGTFNPACATLNKAGHIVPSSVSCALIPGGMTIKSSWN